MKTLSISFCFLLVTSFISEAQKTKSTRPQKAYNVNALEKEIKAYFDSYAEDIRQHRKEEIANRYDRRGYYWGGNGTKAFSSFEEIKNHYLNEWTGPSSFEWKDLSIDVLSPDAAVVTGLFESQRPAGGSGNVSYTAVLVKRAGKWVIRLENKSISALGYTTQPISGSNSVAGPYKYNLRA